MAEALAIIGLAANIAQFLEYGIQFASFARTAYSSSKGDPGNAELDLVASEIKRHCTRISSFPPGATSSLSPDELGIYKVAGECESVADELLATLQSVNESPSRFRTIGAMRVGLKIMTKKPKIQELESRLNRLYQVLQSSLANLLQRGHQSRVMRAIFELTAKNKTMDITLPNRLFQIQESINQKINNSAHDISSLLSKLKEESDKVSNAQRLLEGLHFTSIKFRERSINDAHDETLEWMFSRSTTSFVQWLETGNGVYWISGLPGSGKSTLMKFISSNTRTTDHLRIWSGSSELVTASFFFWNPGDLMEKTQLGLLQSITYQILRSNIDLVPEGQSNRLPTEPWSEPELLELLERVLTPKQSPTTFCFFIDGLDEFQGEENSILQPAEQVIKIVKTLVRSENIKICASGRPWPVFEKAFGAYPKLAIQDHTWNDMDRFCRDMLLKNDRLRMLSKKDHRFHHLALKITHKAQGVWLWAFLVVKDLLEDLNIGESIEFLEGRLEAIPPRLEDYFRGSLSRLKKVHQKEAAQIFLLVGLPHSLGSSEFDIPLLVSQVLPQLDGAALHSSYQSIVNPEIAQNIYLECRSRLHSRCGDLLMIVDEQIQGEPIPVVRYFHRTVTDFIKENRQILYSMIPTGWNDVESLAKLYLAVAKAYHGNHHFFYHFVVEFLLLAATVEEERPLSSEVMAVFDGICYANALSVFGVSRKLGENIKQTYGCYSYLYKHMKSTRSDISFLECLISFGLRTELKKRLEINTDRNLPDLLLAYAAEYKRAGPHTSLPQRVDIIRLLLENGANPNRALIARRPLQDMERLEGDIDSNTGETIWTFLLHDLIYLPRYQRYVTTAGMRPTRFKRITAEDIFDPNYVPYELVELLLRYGADPNTAAGVMAPQNIDAFGGITLHKEESFKSTLETLADSDIITVEEALMKIFGADRTEILISIANEETAITRRIEHEKWTAESTKESQRSKAAILSE